MAGPYAGDPDYDANAARLAAMQRALAGNDNTAAAAAGRTGTLGAGSAPIGPLGAPGSPLDVTGTLNPSVPAGTSTTPSVPGQNAPAAPVPSNVRDIAPTDALSRAALIAGEANRAGADAGRSGSLGTDTALADRSGASTGGSLGSTLAGTSGTTGTGTAFTPLTPAQQQAALAGTGTQPTGPLGGVSTAPTAGGPVLPTAGTPPPLTNQNTSPNGPGPLPGGSAQAGLAGLTNQITSSLQSAQQAAAAPGASPDVQAVFVKYATSILSMLDQQEAQLKAENAQQGTTIDPATQFTIDKLRQNLEDNLKTTREDLNRRGLYESGIELELENRLQKGSASDQAQVLNTRLSDLQRQLDSGLASLRSQKTSTLSQFGLSAANAQNSSDQNALSRAAAASAATQAQDATANQNALTRAANAANQQSSQQSDWWKTVYQGQVGQQNAAAAQNAAAEQQASSQAAARALEQMKINAGAYRVGGSTAQNATAKQSALTLQAVNDLHNTYATREDALNAINQNAANLAQTIGADGIAALQAAANALPRSKDVTTDDRVTSGGREF